MCKNLEMISDKKKRVTKPRMYTGRRLAPGVA